MAKNGIKDYSTTESSNADIAGVNITGGGSPKNLDDGIRYLMAHLAGANDGTNSVLDTWTFADTADVTKKVRLDAGGVTAGQTRVLTLPDRDMNLGIGWIPISSTTLSTATSWTATGLSAFHTLRITGSLRPSTDGDSLRIRTSTDNGVSYDSGASDYTIQHLFGSGATATASTTTTTFFGVGAIGNLTTEGVAFEILIFRFNTARYAQFNARFTKVDTSGNDEARLTTGRRVQATARDAIQLTFSTGNIEDGYVNIEGLLG